MPPVYSRKYLYTFLTILTLCAYSFIVFAAAPTGGYTPGSGVNGTLDPDCAPNATDCFVNVGWTLDPTLGYVYNTTDSIGIGDATPAAALTVGNGDLFQVNSSGAIAAVTGYIQGSGTMSLTSANTTQTTTGSIFALNGNSLTSGTGFYATSSTLSSGSLMNLAVTGTAATGSTQKVLNIATSGANANSSQTTYGAYITNTHTGTSSTNTGLYVSASGATNNFAAVFAQGDVGIGTIFPTSKLDIVGEITAAASVTVASSTTSAIHDFTSTLSATGNTTGLSYSGLRSLVTYSGSTFNSTSAGTYGVSGGLVYAQISSFTSGDVDLLIGLNEFSVHSGSGTVARLRGNRLSAVNSGAGTVTDMAGSAISASNVTGAVTTAYGLTSEISNTGAGTISAASSADLRVITTAGAITNAKGVSFRLVSNGGGSITTGTGIDFSAGQYGALYEPAIEVTGTASGINFSATNDGLTDYAAISGTDVYGIYFGDKSLAGSNSEYALYINDAEAQNYLLNGVRIGGDAAANQFASSTHGAASTVMYIGNSTIDVTAPSDERTKTDIQPTSFGLHDLNQINIVDFKYRQNIIDDNNKQHSGVLAQQVQSIYPEAVTTRTDGYFMVDYKTFIPLIMKSIQDLDVKLSAIDAGAAAITADAGFLEQLRNWFADAANGIAKLFVGEIETKKLCVADETGAKTCLTKSQVDELLSNQSVSPDPGGGGVSENPAPDPEPDPQIEPEPNPDPSVDPTPEPDPVPEPPADTPPVTE